MGEYPLIPVCAGQILRGQRATVSVSNLSHQWLGSQIAETRINTGSCFLKKNNFRETRVGFTSEGVLLFAKTTTSRAAWYGGVKYTALIKEGYARWDMICQ